MVFKCKMSVDLIALGRNSAGTTEQVPSKAFFRCSQLNATEISTTSHFPNFGIYFSVNFLGRRFHQDPWRLNWTNLFGGSMNQLNFFPICLPGCKFAELWVRLLFRRARKYLPKTFCQPAKTAVLLRSRLEWRLAKRHSGWERRRTAVFAG